MGSFPWQGASAICLMASSQMQAIAMLRRDTSSGYTAGRKRGSKCKRGSDRRTAIESVIGHLKDEHSTDRNSLPTEAVVPLTASSLPPCLTSMASCDG